MRPAKKLVWTDNICAGCGRAAYKRKDGREYLYEYSEGGPLVCRPHCAEKAVALYDFSCCGGNDDTLEREGYAKSHTMDCDHWAGVVPETLSLIKPTPKPSKETESICDLYIEQLKRAGA